MHILLFIVCDVLLILVFVEEEVFLARIVRPNIFNAIVDIAVVFHFLQILNHFHWRAGPKGVVNQFFFCCWPRCVFQL